MSADTVIENIVWKAANPEVILVVTSDRMERDAASASGADTIASSLFIEKIREERSRLRDKIQSLNKSKNNIKIGDIFDFPADTSGIKPH
jgi:predicted RNA-binding protein with PIN domain